jgi:hypothetical protein
MAETDQVLTELRDDGGSARVGDEELKELKDDIRQIRAEAGEAIWDRRQTNADTRYCIWDGQSTDGRKHQADLGKVPFPFEGASDTRIRLADKIINEHVREYLTAANRSVPRIVGTESGDDGFAGRMTHLLRWLIRNQWGDQYRRELELAAQWMEGDTPALSFLGVFWQQERALENRTITKPDLLGLYLDFLRQQGQEVDPDTINELVEIVENPAREEDLAGLISGLHPNLTQRRVNAVIKGLQENGEAQFPVEYVRVNLPLIEALRSYEDLFFRSNTTDIQRAPAVYLRRWLTRAEVLEWAGRDRWSRAFVDELLGDENTADKEGQSGFDDTWQTDDGKATDVYDTVESKRGLYEVIWAYTRAANDDGVMGIHVRVFSALCETPAKGRELLPYAHGKYPFVAFPRERLTRRLVDSRSVAELAKTQQNSIKLVTDSIEDHVQVLTNPPIKKPRGSPKYSIALAPFGEIESSPRDPVEFLERPPYPEAADRHRLQVMQEVDDYFGRQNGELPDARAQMAQQHRIDRFLGYLGEALMMALQLCQQYMTDEELQRVSGALYSGRTREEIQGKFDLQLSFDVRDLDQEYLVKKGELVLKYLRPLDIQGALPWNVFLKNIVQGIDPNWADAIPPEAEAFARIEKEEKAAYMEILNGMEPEMPEQIDAPQARVQVLQQQHAPRQANPQAFPPLSLASQALLENRMKYLTQQATQAQNAVIGRVGAAPVELESVGREEVQGTESQTVQGPEMGGQG